MNFEKIREFILRNSKIVFPVILIVCVAITVVFALNAGKAKDEQVKDVDVETVSGSNSSEPTLGVPVTEEALQNNAYPEVNAIVIDYYNAVAEGNVDKVLELSNHVDDTEKIRIQELSKYIDSYPAIEIYTKPGPTTGSYLAYVNYQVKFAGYDNIAPGIQTFYICTAEDGSLYMNEGDVEEYITEYIQQVNMQEDVVELFNKVAAEYNELLLNDSNLSVFLQELNTQMDISVGEALAAVEVAKEQEEQAEEETQEGVGNDTQADTEIVESQPTGPVEARTTTTINVRSSDSETADKLGKLDGGTKIEVLEMRPNGWSKIKYEGKDAFVKSDYIEVSVAEDASSAEIIGTVTALDTVNIRSKDDQTSEKLGVIYAGDTLELIEKLSNGWSKVKYEGKVGYVKSEYVE